VPERLDDVDSMRPDISWEQNRLLAAVSSKGRSDLSSAGTMIELRLGDILSRIGRDAGHVWIPVSGMVSLAISFKDGKTVAVGLVGREGVIGLSPLLDGHDPVEEAVVQLPGQALRVKRAAFRELMERDQPTMLAVLRYAHGIAKLAEALR